MPLPLEVNSTRPRPAKPAVRYRALSPLAVASVVLGGLSILTAFGSTPSAWLLLAVIPLAGIILGWRAARKIRNAPDEWTGLELARLGIGLSVGLWLAGCGYRVFCAKSEVPYGYTRITYEMLQPDPQKPTEPIPQSALDMQDKKVFMQGFMQPGRRQTGIKDFILCPTNGECPFCTQNPKRTEKVRIVLEGDLETTYTTHLVRVAGRFRVNLDDPGGVPYGLDADYIR
jgi:uncharacterized membrane protein YphA (DoxX/SURF4 family)